jgi:hypothetical protein
MKKTFASLLTATMAFSSLLLLFSCSKSKVTDNTDNGSVSEFSAHRYGLNPMQASEWANIPGYHNNVEARVGSTSEVLPTACLLLSPSIRNQGQIGSCTGFCGTETNEILKYYKVNTAAPITGINTSTGASTAATSHFSSTLLSPLFLYYVERCVINKQSISTDQGASMVNICQALQGLSRNSSTGTALTLNSNTFKGECTEALYPYPSTATSTNSQFLTAPGSSAITNAPTYAIGLQTGLTTSSNTTSNSTTSGYFVINSTGSTLLADVKDAIFNKKPVMMGFNVYDNSAYSYFERLNTSKYTYNPLTSTGSLASGISLLGGHAVPIIGYINDASQPGGGVVIVQNSWGTSWGYNGYFYMPYSVLQSTKIVPSGSLYVAM